MDQQRRLGAAAGHPFPDLPAFRILADQLGKQIVEHKVRRDVQISMDDWTQPPARRPAAAVQEG